MRWIAKAVCLVDDVVLQMEFDAPDGATAEGFAYEWARTSSVADSGSVYVVPSDVQPDEEAQEVAGEMGQYSEFVEILYGWPGHWEEVHHG